jgi:hypothetical protein
LARRDDISQGKLRSDSGVAQKRIVWTHRSNYELDTLLEIATELDFGAEAEILAVRDRLSA